MVVNSFIDIDWILNGIRYICIIKFEVFRCFDVFICKIRLGNLLLFFDYINYMYCI